MDPPVPPEPAPAPSSTATEPDAPEALTAEVRTGEWCALHPRAVTLWRLSLTGNGLALAAVLAAAEALLRSAEWVGALPVALVPVGVVVVTLALAVIWPPLVYARWRYRLSDEALELRRGVVVQRWSVVPYHRVQQIDLSRGPIDRALGLTSADLTTAAATTDGSVPALAPGLAEQFRRVVLERAGRGDAV